MKVSQIVVFFATVAILAGCGTARVFEKSRVQSIKKIAVIMYTVPETINYRSNPRDAGSKGMLASVLDAAGKNNGKRAATISHKTFIANLQNAKGLPFKIMSYNDMMANKAFRELYVPPKKKEDKGLMGSALSFLGVGKKVKDGASPKNMNQYGISPWKFGTALSGADGEMDYIKKALSALGVDAVLLINDPGFSFSCEVCLGSTGAASTGSAFNATLIVESGEIIMDIHEYFLTTDAQAAMVTGTVNPLQHESLFKEHGKKMAVVLSDFVADELKTE